jgi:hypothetical protein
LCRVFLRAYHEYLGEDANRGQLSGEIRRGEMEIRKIR